MAKRLNFHYGWVIVACSVLILALDNGMFGSTNSMFVIPVCAELGLARSQFSLYKTIVSIVGAFTMPFYARLIDRFGVRRILIVGTTALSVVTCAYGSATALWHLYVLAFFNGLFYNVAYFMVFGILISNWFESHRGIATGITYAGTGLGGAVMVPIISRIIEDQGWRFAYRFMGVLGLVLMLALSVFLIRDHPEDVGLLPYRSAKEAKKEREASESAVSYSLHEALRVPVFWMLFFSQILISCFCSAMNMHTAPYLTDIGYAPEKVAALVSVYMVFLSLGKIILGYLYDRLGCGAGAVYVAFFCILFPAAALFATREAFAWVYVVALGIASGALSVPFPILVPRYFGRSDYTAILGIFNMLAMLGNALGMPAMGAVFDYLGSYRPAYYVLLTSSCVIAVLFVGAEVLHRKKERQPERDPL